MFGKHHNSPKRHFCVLCFSLLTILACFSISSAGILRIYQIDAEQGDSALLISPSGKTLLIDSGKNGHGSRIKAVMDQAGVSKIDNHVTTHYHEDHLGGIDELIDMGIQVGAAYDRGEKNYVPPKKKAEGSYKDYENAVGNRATKLSRNDSINFDPEVSVTCLASSGTARGESSAVTGKNENDMSIAMLVQYGNFRFFSGGDIENPTEGKIAARNLAMDVDLYKANHHASDTSSSLAFMKDLSPTVIVISNGNNLTYQHPRQSTLNTYAHMNPRPVVFQTNKYLKGGKSGNVADEYIADPETIDQDGTILITVDNEAGNYSVAYPGHNRIYPIKGR